MLVKSNDQLALVTVYSPYCSTKRPPIPVHCCIHMQVVSGSVLSSIPKNPDCTAMKLCCSVAADGWFGSFTTLVSVRKLLHPIAPPLRPTARVTMATLRVERFMSASRYLLRVTPMMNDRDCGMLK